MFLCSCSEPRSGCCQAVVAHIAKLLLADWQTKLKETVNKVKNEVSQRKENKKEGSRSPQQQQKTPLKITTTRKEEEKKSG